MIHLSRVETSNALKRVPRFQSLCIFVRDVRTSSMEKEIMPCEKKNILTNLYIDHLIMVLCTNTGFPKKDLIENFEFKDI